MSPDTATTDRASGDSAHGLNLDWEREQDELGAIAGRFREIRELENGYAYRYPAGDRWIADITRLRDHYKRHFPFFDAELRSGSDGVWLELTGPGDAKVVLSGANERSAGKATRDGTERVTWSQRWLRLSSRYATAHLRALPDFLVIGAAKAGTTSLFSYICQHPHVTPAFRKELYFLDRHWSRGERYWRTYFPTRAAQALHRKVHGHQPLSGEATPCYMFDPRAARRAHELVPRAKLLVSLRNPVDRAYSYYCMNARRGLETLSFEEAIDREEERLDGELERMLADDSYFSDIRHHASYVARGLYAQQLQDWRRYFPEEQFLLMTQDELKPERRSATLARVQSFLELPHAELRDTGRRNYVPYPPMAKSTRERLVDYFRPHNAELYDLLGQRFDWDR